MSTTAQTERREGFWRALARVLGRFGDALDMTEATLLAERVYRLENEVSTLKQRLAELS
jgi:hypothetical protein